MKHLQRRKDEQVTNEIKSENYEQVCMWMNIFNLNCYIHLAHFTHLITLCC